MLVQACRADGWLIEPGDGRSRSWIRVRHPRAATPAQGWKLHVSATVASAADVLQAAVPVLLDDDATFKVAASLEMLASLNEGNGGSSQIGKFITVYPCDDAQAVRLAVALDEATRGLRGPAVPSDRPLRHGRSLVSYRYGGFSTPLMQTPLGDVLPSLTTVDGQMVPDRRRPWYAAPESIEDPFIAAGVAEPPPLPNLMVADRYALITLVQSSPRGAVYLAVDTRTAARVIVKRARHDALGSDQGQDARDRLRAEADVLTALAPHPGIPVIYDLVEDQDDVYLVMEDIEGDTLEEHVGGLLRHGRCLPAAQVITWGSALARILGHVHERGFVYRDLKSPNVIVARDGRLSLIDFDMAQRAGDTSKPFGKGTRGYTSPQQHAGRPPAVTDDVYGLGALLYYLATGAEPSQTPAEFSLCDRAVETLNPAITPVLARVIARCLAPDPNSRYSSMRAIEQARSAPNGLQPFAIGRSASASTSTEDGAGNHTSDLARRLADTLCAVALPAPSGEGVAWATSHPLGMGGIRTRDINIGSGGTLLALAELAGAFDAPRYRETLAQGARWLATAPPFAGDPLAGLYVGEAGIGAALLRAGQILDDAALIDAAIDRGRYVASLPHTSPDLFNGTAGRLRFHLWLWDQTGADEHLAAARAAGAVLLESADHTADGGVRWVLPLGYGSMSGTAPLGYAHGTAGIADALLNLFEATGDVSTRDAAAGAARWLADQAVPVLDDGSGLGWPATEGEEPFLPWWCHGATGIGRLFLHAATLDLIPQAATLATGAARAVARGARAQAASQCHGLAGSIEFLLDVYQATGDDTWLHEARTLAVLLDAYAAEQDGNLVFSAETPGLFTPDYMTGYAGVAVCLLRLADPTRRPHQLSRAGFRYRGGRGTRDEEFRPLLIPRPSLDVRALGCDGLM
ncbi:MAG: protein kinase [Chloroflexi bacterium]|nr:protein kinase [Chloroflexota bacterium]